MSEIYDYATKRVFYKGVEELQLDVDDVLSQYNFSNIKLALYKINKIYTELPFLEFILFKNLNNYSFLNIINYNQVDCDSESLKKFIITELKKCIEIENYNKLSVDNLDFKGFKYFNNELYVFIDLTDCSWGPYDGLLNVNKYWTCIVDELLNKKEILDFPIDSNVTNFLVENPKFLQLESLFNSKKEYEVPVVCYKTQRNEEMSNAILLGSFKTNELCLGENHYFTDYQTAIRNCSKIEKENQLNKKKIKMGIVRYVVFLGKSKYIANEIEFNNMKNKEKSYSWNNMYDSLYIGNYLLNNGLYNPDIYLIVKNYEQQVPISYHIIKSTNLNFDNFNSLKYI